MKKASGASWVGTVVAVAALAAVGIGGYNVLRTGCPLGTGCGDSAAAASETKGDACCPLTAAGAVTPVANTECCKGKSAEECCKAAGEACTPANCGDKAEGCGEKTGECPGDAKPECPEGKGECHGKSECTEAGKPASPANPG
ncbi:MAG: hypothetical protein FJ255_06390 [Phycisphaerae bacterium]|nr:hypothetical protein [Phycisphaerae bacterium]